MAFHMRSRYAARRASTFRGYAMTCSKSAKIREDRAKAAHHHRLRQIENARKLFIAAQHRAVDDGSSGSVDEVQQRRMRHAASARTALASENDLRDQIERSIEERNDMLAAMRYRRTVERIDEGHTKAWANLASQAAERALDDIAIAGWERRQS